MRTPGRERDLIAGFLASESIIEHSEDLLAVEPCRDAYQGQPEPHIWNAALADGVAFDPRPRRFGTVGSSCGLCGVQSLDDLEKKIPEIPKWKMPESLQVSVLLQTFEAMQSRQTLFQKTAAVHAAALWSETDGLLDLAEDVGRHNAVDKVLGACLRGGLYPLEVPRALLVSGRISFEIMQKAAMAGIALVAGISAPTSLAVDIARKTGMTLFGMVRDQRLNQYSG